MPRTLGILACAVVAIVFFTIAACDGDNNTVNDGSTTSSSSGGAPGSATGRGNGTLPDGGKADCFAGKPTTHQEIINACTDATLVVKNPTLTKLLPDGGLPPLE